MNPIIRENDLDLWQTDAEMIYILTENTFGFRK